MNATRLLVLGAIRIMQPVHGYDVRRELLTWRLEELANVKPGSIYGAMRTLDRDGCIAVHARESEYSRPERTTYVLTGEGEKEFHLLREELLAALKARLGQLQGQLAATAFTRNTIRDGATGAGGEIPEHVREILDFVAGAARAEVDWTRALQRRVRAGAYTFAGETGFPVLGAGVGIRGEHTQT